MIIPMVCFTCGKPISAFKEKYNELVLKYNNNMESLDDPTNLVKISKNNMEKTPQGKALDELGYDRICCRRMFLADQPVAYDLSNKIAHNLT